MTEPVGAVVALAEVPAWSPGQLRAALGALPEGDRARCRTITSPAARARSVAARVLLRAVLAEEAGPHAAAWSLAPDASGRPQAGAPGWDVSLTHSGGLVAVAVARGCRVGVDVQVPPRRLAPGLARPFLPGELAPEEVAATADPRAFLAAWTRLEALVKAAGLALGDGPRGRELLRRDGDAAVHRVAGRTLWSTALTAGAGHALAVCTDAALTWSPDHPGTAPDRQLSTTPVVPRGACWRGRGA